MHRVVHNRESVGSSRTLSKPLGGRCAPDLHGDAPGTVSGRRSCPMGVGDAWRGAPTVATARTRTVARRYGRALGVADSGDHRRSPEWQDPAYDGPRARG